MIYITKGKTLRANTIDEGAVGKLYCVLVQAGAMGGGGATQSVYIYNIFYVTLGY